MQHFWHKKQQQVHRKPQEYSTETRKFLKIAQNVDKDYKDYSKT